MRAIEMMRRGGCAALAWSLAASAGWACAASGPVIEMDGDLSDWPEGVHALASGRSMYFRLDLEEVAVLQTAPWTVMLALDLDNDASTGRKFAVGDGDALGADVVVKAPPPWGGDTQAPSGVGAMVYSADGAGRRLGAYGVDVHWAPTHAAQSFEFRVMRRSGNEGAIPLLERGAGTVRGRFLAMDAGGDVVWEAPVFELALPERDAEPWHVDDLVPPKPEGAVRVLSYNVLWAQPLVTPEAFDRLFRAIDPDVMLFQEWDSRHFDAPLYTAPELVRWFEESMPEVESWHAVRGEERGVVIVSRFPAERLPVGTITALPEGDPRVRTDRGVRFIGARVRTPLGDMIAGSFHLKCCGSLGTEEDAQRLGEARAINRAIRAEIQRDAASMVVMAGDSNLVGGVAPLAALMHSGDVDGSDLHVVDLPVLGDRSRVTWRDGRSRFPPGRLDYALVGDANVEVVSAFVLDTSILSDAELARLGLERHDAEHSDHLPLVIDLKPRRGGTR